jgi:hypothetical protein
MAIIVYQGTQFSDGKIVTLDLLGFGMPTWCMICVTSLPLPFTFLSPLF